MMQKKSLLFFSLSVLLLLGSIPFQTQSVYAVTTVEYLVIAGGGGGSGGAPAVAGGGGGGAGGYRNATGFTVTPQAYTITIGAGGAGNTGAGVGGSGSNSIFSSITSSGGGGGGSGSDSGACNNGVAGGSGGGAGGNCGGAGGAGNTPSTSPSQGNNGGASSGSTAGGGGGSGGAGSAGGAGVGTSSSITGSPVTRAVGGATNIGFAGTVGGANTGTGGSNYASGGSGVVIIKYLTGTLTATGGTITYSGGYTIHTFTTSGTFEVSNPVPSAPLNNELITTSTSAMTLDWDTPTDCQNCTGYKIWNTTGVDSVFLNDTENTNTSYQLTGLPSGTIQSLMVSAWNATGIGANSTTVSNFTLNTPPVLDKVNSYNSTAFNLFYTINGTFNGIKVMIDELPYATFSTLISNSSSSNVTLVVNGITQAVDTAVKILAHNLGGTSSASNQIINATSATSAPVLTVAQGSGVTLNLSWVAPVTGVATSYTVQRSPAGCASFSNIATGETGISYSDSNTQAVTTYCYQVLSLNEYGSTASNQDSEITGTQAGGGAGGSSGGAGGSSGGASPSQQSFVSDILGIDFIDQIHRAVLSQLVSGSIKVVWDSPNNMKINSIIVSDSPFTIVFQSTPFTMIGDPSGTSEGNIGYSVKIPSKFCEDKVTVGCVEHLRYEIPVEIKAEHDGDNVTKNTVIMIDMSGKADIPFAFVLLTIGSVPIAFGVKKLLNRKHKRKVQSSNGKSRKNGSANKSLSL